MYHQDNGNNKNMMYHQDNGNNKNQHKKIWKRQCKIIRFNLPFPKIVKTNIGKKFFKLINPYFPKHHKMSKIFDKNTIKLSYNCCRNIGSVIASRNRRIIQLTSNNHGRNCRNRAECQLGNKCLTSNTVNRAMVSAPSKPAKKYFGITKTSFKDRFRNHARYFHHKNYVSSIELSNTCGS